jgi:hypothetical protein
MGEFKEDLWCVRQKEKKTEARILKSEDGIQKIAYRSQYTAAEK